MAKMPKYYKIHTDGCEIELAPIYEELAFVHHGHWKLEYDAIINQVFCVCSECGGGSFAQSDYCPNCGADMGGADNG